MREKKTVYEEATARVNFQREENDELERPLELARVQVQVPTPLPSLPSDGRDADPGLASEVLGGSEDEARRDCETDLGMDVDPERAARKRGGSFSPSAPPEPNSQSPSEIDSNGSCGVGSAAQTCSNEGGHHAAKRG